MKHKVFDGTLRKYSENRHVHCEHRVGALVVQRKELTQMPELLSSQLRQERIPRELATGDDKRPLVTPVSMMSRAATAAGGEQSLFGHLHQCPCSHHLPLVYGQSRLLSTPGHQYGTQNLGGVKHGLCVLRILPWLLVRTPAVLPRVLLIHIAQDRNGAHGLAG